MDPKDIKRRAVARAVVLRNEIHQLGIADETFTPHDPIKTAHFRRLLELGYSMSAAYREGNKWGNKPGNA